MWQEGVGFESSSQLKQINKFQGSLALIILSMFSLIVLEETGQRTIVASHDTANARGEFEHVGHGGGVQQLVL